MSALAWQEWCQQWLAGAPLDGVDSGPAGTAWRETLRRPDSVAGVLAEQPGLGPVPRALLAIVAAAGGGDRQPWQALDPLALPPVLGALWWLPALAPAMPINQGCDPSAIGRLADYGLAHRVLELGVAPLTVDQRCRWTLVDALERGDGASAWQWFERWPLDRLPQDRALALGLGWLVDAVTVGVRPDEQQRQALGELLALADGSAALAIQEMVVAGFDQLGDLVSRGAARPATGPSWLQWQPLRRAMLCDAPGDVVVPADLGTGPLAAWFVARQSLLTGRSEAAAKALARMRQLARLLGLERRLALEMRLARDVDGWHLLELSALAAETSGPSGAAGGETGAAISAASDRQSATLRGRSARTNSRRQSRTLAAVPAGVDLDAIIGDSRPMQDLRAQLHRAGSLTAPVLLRGASGAGKDLAAKAIHGASTVADGPLISINCASIPDTLMIGELFGYRKGAFSGADADRDGLLAAAAGGSVFLDEIGDLPATVQAALLRLLDESAFRPLGSSQTRTLECRLIAATNVDLETAVADGRFRMDLLHRLRRLEVVLPSLDDRRQDIEQLAPALLTQVHPRGASARVEAAVVSFLQRLPWPGNVRQLRNELEAMVFAAPDQVRYGLDDFRAGLAGRIDGSQRLAAGDAPAANQLAPAPAQDAPGQPSATRSGGTEDRQIPLDRPQRLAWIISETGHHGRMTRKAVMAGLGVSQSTATLYLRALVESGELLRREPSRAPASHYFVLADVEV